jgi:hypothetical protein
VRLTSGQIERLRTATRRHFGADAGLWVFGSRVDDAARGGDFDVYVEARGLAPAALVESRLAMLVELHDTPEFDGERIDLVVRRADVAPELPIHRAAREQGVQL